MKDFIIGKSLTSDKNVVVYPSMLNRHGIISGATGTGKTVSLQVVAEQLSKLGTSVFLTDIKGDVSGISRPSVPSEKILTRMGNFPDITYSPSGFPVNFMDTFGKLGHPLRVTPTTMGPLILSRLLDLNDTQEGVLHIAFKFADEQGLLILDLKDLQSLLKEMGNHLSEIRTSYGNVSSASIGAIQRRLMILEDQGADNFFGEPEFEVKDLLKKDYSGKGLIHILDSTSLLRNPQLYGSILLWLLSELFEQLDEVGDPEIPRLALFFDEAHLLFSDLPKSLSDKIETVTRLIRSKGVSIFFVTQSPSDIPDKILEQLGTRVQHALRSYTPKQYSEIKKVTKTFRTNEDFNIETTLPNLGVGEALVSVLSPKGEPLTVEKTLIRAPESQIGPITEDERSTIIENSLLSAKYKNEIDRESAYEVLKKRAEEALTKNEEDNNEKKTSNRKKSGPIQAFLTSLARSFGTQIGRQIFRGVLGTLLKK